MTRFTFEGQGRTVGEGAPVLLIIFTLLLLGSGGAVAAVSAAVIDALIGAVVVVFLTVAALGVFVVHRARNPSPEGFVRMPGVRMPVRYELDGERPAIGQSGPRELHNHYHFHGAEGAELGAEILRRSQRPEQ